LTLTLNHNKGTKNVCFCLSEWIGIVVPMNKAGQSHARTEHKNTHELHCSGAVINQDTSSIGEAQEKGRMAAKVWISPDINIHGFVAIVDGAVDKSWVCGDCGWCGE
jgi:hypothetical protein